jgi:hypothetical protein
MNRICFGDTFPVIPRCKGVQFEAAWGKHKDDPNLTNLESSLSGRDKATVNIIPFVVEHE